MRFTVSTKPLIDALNLGVVNANVSKFYQKSCLAQITATRRELKINLEAKSIYSELVLKGSGDEDTECIAFVDCLTLKQLVNTFEANVTTIEFVEGGIVLHSGKSTFTLPKMVEGDDVQLKKPYKLDSGAPAISIDQSDWKFIKDYQMYAIAMSFIHPVYTRVWVGENGDVMVGDYDNSIFTHSKKNKLGKTCLLSDTIVNLFNSLPEGATIKNFGDSYIINVKTDSFEYMAEFCPDYETDDAIGSYNSDIILGTMEKNEETAVVIKPSVINKFLNQAKLISSNSEDTINFIVEGSEVILRDKNIDCKVSLEKEAPRGYRVLFKTDLLKSAISNFDEDDIKVCPIIYEEDDVVEVSGVVMWTKNMTTVIAGAEE